MNYFKHHKKFILIAGIFLFLFLSTNVRAANVGDIVNFNVDKSFDASGRTQIPATLIKISQKLYFYVEKPWWDSQSPVKQGEISSNLDALSNEFDNNIYPKLTSTFGLEWNPGIDKNNRITVLFQSINATEGGYFREADEYEKIQLPSSNEREMVYLSVSYADQLNVRIVLGHEFTHLITFNQKNKIFGVEEDTWLNEARADYASTILGYDDNYDGSNLQQRVEDFVDNPSDSLTDWTSTKYDYASVNLFSHYLVDHYGIKVLSDSLKTRFVGIESINEALFQEGSKSDFSQIFTDWTIDLAINDCSQSSKYCYSNQNLKDLKVSPSLIFIPLTGSSSLSATDVTRNWAGNWQKIIGGSGNLTLDFSSLSSLNFQVPYVVYDKNNNYSIKFLTINNEGKGEVSIQDFGTNYKSLIIIPSLQTKISGFDGVDFIYPYSINISVTGKDDTTDQILIQKLLAQIDSLKKQIADIIAQRQGGSVQNNICSQLNINLSFGTNSDEVKCLQQFLKNQGVSIYPEGFVTGNFGNLTKTAVIKFQEKYASDVLTPLGLSSGTGYVGATTRAKINKILNGG
jgi:peptidoglycan hydrolase-like protein with peptidoglycan-binding domain